MIVSSPSCNVHSGPVAGRRHLVQEVSLLKADHKSQKIFTCHARTSPRSALAIAV